MIDRAALTRSRVVVLALVVAAVVYKLLNATGLGGTSLMFVGLPAVLAVVVAWSPPAKTATGSVFKVMSLMLLLAGVLFVEAAVCILMAAPLFFAVGGLVGMTIDYARSRNGSALHASIVLPLVLLTLQVPASRDVTATAERVVAMQPDDVPAALARTVNFDRGLPAFFRFGRFPRPVASLAEGDRYVIAFDGHEPPLHKLATHEHEPSLLVLRVIERSPGRVVFAPESDTTMMSQWAALRRSVVEWAPATGGTRVRWTLQMHRKLDPAWYFGPMQTYAAERAAAYLIDAIVGS